MCDCILQENSLCLHFFFQLPHITATRLGYHANKKEVLEVFVRTHIYKGQNKQKPPHSFLETE